MDGEQLRDEALKRVEDHAPETWVQLAHELLRIYARNHAEFTAPEFQQHSGLPKPPENRALGAIIRAAAKAGTIENTHRTRESEDPKQHRRPCTVWRSTTYWGGSR